MKSKKVVVFLVSVVIAVGFSGCSWHEFSQAVGNAAGALSHAYR